jgi:hypothetical protein
MGIGEAGAVKDAKPQAHADKSSSPDSVKQFNDALGQSANSNGASSTRAASGTAAHGSGGQPMIVRIDAQWRSKSATATLSDGSKVPLTLTKNQLAPGDTEHTLTYGAESGPQDSPIVELEGASGTNTILWQQPSDYALSPKIIVSIKLDPEESARRRIARLPQFVQDHLKQLGGGDLQSLAEYGEGLVKSGATKESLAPIEIQGHAPPDPDFLFVEAARKGRYSQFPSFDEFKKNLTRQVEAAKEQARTKGLTPPDPFAGAEWKDDPAAAKEKWDKYVFAQYDKAVKDEAAKLRHVGEVASMAQNAWLQALGLSAAVGTGAAGLAAAGEALAVPTLLEGSTGVSTATWLGQFGTFALGTSFGLNLINRSKEGIEAGSNPVAVVSTAATDTFGGKVVEKITNKSNLTGEDLNLSTGERVTGGILDVLEGGMNILGVREFAKTPGVPETPIPGRTPADPIGPANDTPKVGAMAGPRSAEIKFADFWKSGEIEPRTFSATEIKEWTARITKRMKQLGIPKDNIGIRGVPDESGTAFNPVGQARGTNVRGKGISVHGSVEQPWKDFPEWNDATIETRIDAVIAHEWMEFNQLTHWETVELAIETKLPISKEAKQLLLAMAKRGGQGSEEVLINEIRRPPGGP